MIDWLLSVLRRIPEYFTNIGDVTLAGEWLQYLRLVPAPTTILTERGRYRAIPVMTRDLGLHVSSHGPPPLSRFLRQTTGIEELF